MVPKQTPQVSGVPSNSNSKSNVVIARQLLRRRRVVAEQECRERAVAVAPNISNAAHREARAESRQAQSHENAAQHEDRKHEQRLCTTCAGVSSCPLNLKLPSSYLYRKLEAVPVQLSVSSPLVSA
jgi:hypothetical protein